MLAISRPSKTGKDIYRIKTADPLDIVTVTWRQFLALVTELP